MYKQKFFLSLEEARILKELSGCVNEWFSYTETKDGKIVIIDAETDEEMDTIEAVCQLIDATSPNDFEALDYEDQEAIEELLDRVEDYGYDCD